MYCVGCGEPLRADSGHCPHCTAPVRGAEFFETISLDYGKRFVVPSVCCCCLAPRFENVEEEIASITLTGDKRYTKVPIPWCAGCKKRTKGFDRLAGLAWVVSAAVLYVALGPFVVDAGTRFAASFFGGISGVLVAPYLFRRYSAQADLPGHVKRCDGVGGSAGKKNAELYFKNKAFAQIWRDLNSGIESKAPAMAWARRAGELARKGPAPEEPASAPEGWAAHRSRTEVRDQLQAHKPGLTSRLHFTRGASGADASAEILRFVVTELVIGESGLTCTSKKGAVLKVPWAGIARVLARQTPQEPPFDGTIFLDIVPTVSRTPLRIVPTTRANYTALPGAGSTSHENFRRLVRELRARNPEVEIERDSAPYLEDGRGFPPRFDGSDELVAYDTSY